METDDTSIATHSFDELEMASGDVVIYDTENHRAWIQSDSTRSLIEMA